MQERLFVGGLIWHLSSDFYFVLDLLFGQDGCEVFHLKDLADFHFVVIGAAAGATLHPLDGLFEGLDLQDGEAGDELLGLGEGAVGHLAFQIEETEAKPSNSASSRKFEPWILYEGRKFMRELTAHVELAHTVQEQDHHHGVAPSPG
jgi:hypothetical protein